MASGVARAILARAAALVGLGALIACLLAPAGPAAAVPLQREAPAERDRLSQRLQSWPDWSLPAPLPRPGRRDLLYPAWFLGDWQVQDSDGIRYRVRFVQGPEGVVGDRAFNALAVGRALLGDGLRSVANDPGNPNRQIARLAGPQGSSLELESTVVGRRREQPDDATLLVDELALQVLHGPGEPAVSRVETLTRFRRDGRGGIDAEQWQASYASPSAGLVASASRSSQRRLRFDRPGHTADPAS